MQTFSVDHVGLLCRALGATSGAPGLQQERQAEMSTLLGLLTDIDPTKQEAAEVQMVTEQRPLRDPRPLRRLYRHLAPACSAEVALAWQPDTGPEALPQKTLLQQHRKEYLAKLLNVLDKGKANLDILKLPVHEDLAFGVAVLERLAAGNRTSEELGSWRQFCDIIAFPILRRMKGRGVSFSDRVRIWGYIIKCLEKKRSEAQQWHTFDDNDLLHRAARWWDHCVRYAGNEEAVRSKDVVRQLAALLQRPEQALLNALGPFIQVVQPSLRYSLLRMCLPHIAWDGSDITEQTTADFSELGKVQGKWPHLIFTKALPRPSAIALLDVLATQRGREDKFGTIQSLQDDASDFLQRSSTMTIHERGDETILRVYLLSQSRDSQGEPDWLLAAKRGIETYKKSSMQAREPGDRAQWAKLALNLAIASSSLASYWDTLLWARRYNRDQQVAQKLYDGNQILTKEGLDLLSGMPFGKLTRSFDYVKRDIQAANEIICQLFETASMALREPSFSKWDWQVIDSLPHFVVQRRLSRMLEQQKMSQKANDEDWYHAVWEPTIDMLLVWEDFSNKESNAKLNWNYAMGRSRAYVWEPEVVPAPNIMHFFDELARRRDAFWTQLRGSRKPATMTLPPPWPRGLPVQCLVPTSTSDKFIPPYVLERARAVVLLDPLILAQPPPTDEDSLDAIGTFVDSYKTAENIFVEGADSEQARQERKRQAEQNLQAAFQLRGLSDDEVLRRSSSHWANVWSVYTKATEKQADLVLPEPQDPVQPIEWNPDPDLEPSTKQLTRKLDLAIIHCMVAASDAPRLTDTFFMPQPTVEVEKVSGFWSRADEQIGKRRDGPTNDAYIVVSAHIINSTLGADTSLFLKPFPATNDVRFPALYLDEDFLDRGPGKGADAQDQSLALSKRLSPVVPPVLFAKLAQSTLQKTEKSEAENVWQAKNTFIRVIKLLAASDRPELACPLVAKVVLDWQEDSSWHRTLFSAGFLKQLSAKSAAGFLLDMAGAICERLRRQTESQRVHRQEVARLKREGKTEEADSLPAAAPFVKVTTVKMLAEILRTTTVLDPGVACSILVMILTTATHIDIRSATVDALLELLADAIAKGSTSTGQQATIIDALATHAVPIAGSLHERVGGLRDDDWAAAEADDGEIPEVWSRSEGLPPLLYALTVTWPTDEVTEHLLLQGNETFLSEWRARIIAPILETSMSNNARWMRLFLRKFVQKDRKGSKRELRGDPRDFNIVPEMPVDDSILFSVFCHDQTHLDKLAYRVFDVVEGVMRMQLDPSKQVLSVNAAVEANKTLASSKHGRHWLEQWRNDYILRTGFTNAKNLLLRTEEPSIVGRFSKLLFEILLNLVERGEVEMFNTYATELASAGTAKEWAAWNQRCRPLLSEIVKRIEDIRTSGWQEDKDRRPGRLPNIFDMDVRLLRYPHVVHQEEVQDISLNMFLEAAMKLIGSISEDGNEPYHERWSKLKAKIETVLPAEHSVNAAVYFGGVLLDGKAPRLVAHLRVELAEELLCKTIPTREQCTANSASIKRLTDSWLDSPVEAFRERALRARNNWGLGKSGQQESGSEPFGIWD
jgi:hypothetical protein